VFLPLILAFDVGPPALEIRVTEARQGNTLAIWVRGDAASMTLRFLDRERPLYPHGDWHRALVGIPIKQEPGPHPLVLEATDASGNVVVEGHVVDIADVDWPFGGTLRGLPKPPTDNEAKKAAREARDGAYAATLPDQSWDDPMSMPLQGRITSDFGRYRARESGYRSHHDALDIGAASGTPIYAAGPGEVLVSAFQPLHGNAVILGHGQEVTTSYNHMSGLAVEVGEHVNEGDLVGWVGSTGQSTGPHLHWGVVVDEIAVDPTQWLDEAFLLPPAPKG
jgi:hypothetical protein